MSCLSGFCVPPRKGWSQFSTREVRYKLGGAVSEANGGMQAVKEDVVVPSAEIQEDEER